MRKGAAGVVGRISDAQGPSDSEMSPEKLGSVQISPENERRVRISPGNAQSVRTSPEDETARRASIAPW